MNFYEKVYAVVKQIPKGKVATYGQIALLCGNPRAARAVGYALHCNPEPGIIPCHRVVTAREEQRPDSHSEDPTYRGKCWRVKGVVFDDEGKVLVENFHLHQA